MEPFEYFNHTADTMMRAYGKNFEEAASNLILAVYNVIVDTSTVQCVESREVVVEAASKETLIYELINELVYHLDTSSFLGAEVGEISFSKTEKGFKLRALIHGDDDATLYDVHGQIKSATYSDMAIIEHEGLVTIQAVLDL